MYHLQGRIPRDIMPVQVDSRVYIYQTLCPPLMFLLVSTSPVSVCQHHVGMRVRRETGTDCAVDVFCRIRLEPQNKIASPRCYTRVTRDGSSVVRGCHALGVGVSRSGGGGGGTFCCSIRK